MNKLNRRFEHSTNSQKKTNIDFGDSGSGIMPPPNVVATNKGALAAISQSANMSNVPGGGSMEKLRV